MTISKKGQRDGLEKAALRAAKSAKNLLLAPASVPNLAGRFAKFALRERCKALREAAEEIPPCPEKTIWGCDHFPCVYRDRILALSQETNRKRRSK